MTIAGTTVTLTGTDEFGNMRQRDDHDRRQRPYSFTGLNPSNAAGYTVTETPPAARQPRGPDLDHHGRD